MRRMGLWLASWLLLAGACGAQDSVKRMPKDAQPVFDVASIHPSDPEEKNQGFQLRGRRVVVLNESVTSMIMFAYGVQKSQILEGPEWIREPFDVNGVPDVEGEPNLPQMQHMIQDLLRTRFGLKFRREPREMTAYVITVDKGGSKLAPSKSPEDASPDQTGNGEADSQMMKFTNNSMSDFRLGMQYFLDKPVVDHTGLSGRYDFTLRWDPKRAPDIRSDLPDIFTACREQLGLRIEAQKAPVEVMVVEAITRPTAN